MRIARRTFLASSIGTTIAPAIVRVACADTPPITPKLHRGEYIDLHPAAGFGLDFACPRHKEFIVDARYRRKRVVQLERYWRRVRARETKNRGSDGGSDR